MTDGHHPGRRPAPDWAARLSPLLDAPVARREAEGVVELVAGRVRVEIGPGRIATHGLTWTGMDRRCHDAVAVHVVAAARLLADAAPVGGAWRPRWWRPLLARRERADPWVVRVLRDAGLPRVDAWPEDARLDEGALPARAAAPARWRFVDAWPEDARLDVGARPARAAASATWRFGDATSGARASIVDGVLTFAYPHEAWLTSHARGVATTAYASLPCAALPADPAAAVALVRLLVEASPARDPRPAFACRFCAQRFDALAFHRPLGACHACAERHLGVVH